MKRKTEIPTRRTVQLFDCTLSLVLRGFGRWRVLAGHATSSVSCRRAISFACTLLCTFD